MVVTSWPLPSEIIANAKIEATFEIERSSGLVPDDSAGALDDTALNKSAAA